MSEPRKRGWFQLHLSTCVVLMFVAGPLLGANIQRHYLRVRDVHGDFASHDFDLGWPFYFYGNYGCGGDLIRLGARRPEKGVLSDALDRLAARKLPRGWANREFDPGIRGRELVANAASWLSILLLAAMLPECLIRRRERKRPEIQA